MNNIAKNDKNFLINSKFERNDIVFYSALSDSFSLHGVKYENGKFRRMPEKIAKTVSEGVYYSHALTAGGRLRFTTNSSFVAISVTYDCIEKSSHFSMNGMAGFDLYEEISETQKHMGSFTPPLETESHFESLIELQHSDCHHITINFPTYSAISELYIGLSEGAYVKPARPYQISKPLAYYGSSITHGACSSRPGNTYPEMISRALNCDYINLGFGGNALGEQAIAEYIADLDMSVFVLDYDYNAPDVEHLAATHKNMYRTVREKHPSVPILMISRPKPLLTEKELERLEIVKTTYQDALDNGDKNVYFIPGYELIPENIIDSAKVDKVHPNDLGFYCMANRISKELREILMK
jgi:hypothetical protein